VADFKVVQGFESSDGLNKEVPYLFLSVFCLVFLVFLDGLQEITIVTDLHDDTQVAWLTLKECLLVTDDIWVVDRGQNSDFI